MPCPPGFLPVNAHVHAQSVIAGQVERRGALQPRARRADRFGRRPCSMSGSMTSKVAESQPRTINLGVIGGYGDSVGVMVGVGVGGLRPLGSLIAPWLGIRSMHTCLHL